MPWGQNGWVIITASFVLSDSWICNYGNVSVLGLSLWISAGLKVSRSLSHVMEEFRGFCVFLAQVKFCHKCFDHLKALIFLSFCFSDLLIHPNRLHMIGVLGETQYCGKTVERRTEGDCAYWVQLLALEECVCVRQKMIFHYELQDSVSFWQLQPIRIRIFTAYTAINTV